MTPYPLYRLAVRCETLSVQARLQGLAHPRWACSVRSSKRCSHSGRGRKQVRVVEFLIPIEVEQISFPQEPSPHAVYVGEGDRGSGFRAAVPQCPTPKLQEVGIPLTLPNRCLQRVSRDGPVVSLQRNSDGVGGCFRVKAPNWKFLAAVPERRLNGM